MGCCQSRAERQEAVTRCKARRRYTRQLAAARRDMAAAHSRYLRALRATGAALLQFADSIAPAAPPSSPRARGSRSSLPPPPTPPPLSPMATSSSSMSSSSVLPPPPPPPPPPPMPMQQSANWDFWDPFSSSRPVAEDAWDDAATITSSTVSNNAAAANAAVIAEAPAVATGAMAVVTVPRGAKELPQIVHDVDEYFLKAADAGNTVAAILEAPSCEFESHMNSFAGRMRVYGKNMNPLGWSRASSNVKSYEFGSIRKSNGESGIASHSSTVEKLYAWERKLYLEVKSYEKIKDEHEKRVEQLRRQEVKGADYLKVEKMKMDIESLESKMLVANQGIEATSSEIIRLRECELFPQLLHLVSSLVGMWRGMYESHQVQTHIVQQLEYLNNAMSSGAPTSDAHREAALQLEVEVERWYSSFCSLIKSQHDYIYSLTGWLRLSIYHRPHDSLTKVAHQHTDIYELCEEWRLAADRIPDKVASEGIKTFLTAINAIVAQQAEEQKQKKRSESAFKDLEKRLEELRSLESKHGAEEHLHLADKRAKVEALRCKADEEKSRYEKSVGATRAMTLNNLQTGLPNVFQAMTGFASVCREAFESVCNFKRAAAAPALPGADGKGMLA